MTLNNDKEYGNKDIKEFVSTFGNIDLLRKDNPDVLPPDFVNEDWDDPIYDEYYRIIKTNYIHVFKPKFSYKNRFFYMDNNIDTPLFKKMYKYISTPKIKFLISNYEVLPENGSNVYGIELTIDRLLKIKECEDFDFLSFSIIFSFIYGELLTVSKKYLIKDVLNDEDYEEFLKDTEFYRKPIGLIEDIKTENNENTVS